MKQPISFLEVMKSLQSEKDCREFLEDIRWQGEPVCPHCMTQSHEEIYKHYKLKVKGEFNGLYKCKNCKKRFTVIQNTMFEGTHIPLQKWFYTIYIFLSHKKGISSVQLSKDIVVTQKTAWFMLNRIRHNFENKINVRFEDITQADETYVGGKNRKRRGIKHTQGRSTKIKTPVFGLESDGKVYTIVVPNTVGITLKPIINFLVKKGSTIVSDGWGAYKGLSKKYNHIVVEHSKGEYVKDGFHTNNIEGFWSHLKRGIFGIYHLASRKHLSKYCNEFAFRYNTRDMSDFRRFAQFTSDAYKRLSYRDLIAA